MLRSSVIEISHAGPGIVDITTPSPQMDRKGTSSCVPAGRQPPLGIEPLGNIGLGRTHTKLFPWWARRGAMAWMKGAGEFEL